MGKIDKVVEGYERQALELRERMAMYEHHFNAARAELNMIEARIEGIREAAELLIGNGAAPNSQPKQKRSRRLTGHWRKIMRAVSLLDEFDYDDLEFAVDAAGHKAGRDTLRSQMSLYKASGLVEPTDDGHFRVTEKGREAAGIEPNAEPENTFADPDTEAVTLDFTVADPAPTPPAPPSEGWATWETKHGPQ